jgi:hypothetical protein
MDNSIRFHAFHVRKDASPFCIPLQILTSAAMLIQCTSQSHPVSQSSPPNSKISIDSVDLHRTCIDMLPGHLLGCLCPEAPIKPYLAPDMRDGDHRTEQCSIVTGWWFQSWPVHIFTCATLFDLPLNDKSKLIHPQKHQPERSVPPEISSLPRTGTCCSVRKYAPLKVLCGALVGIRSTYPLDI